MNIQPSKPVIDRNSTKPAGAEFWHIWTVRVPRRSIAGRLVWGRVWRRHNGRHWVYKRLIEFDDRLMKHPHAANRSPNLPDPHGEDNSGQNRNKDVRSGVDVSVNFKPELPTEPQERDTTRHRLAIWPYVWLALIGVAMVGWLAGTVWLAVILVRWLWDF
jgi:hypothetical protein